MLRKQLTPYITIYFEFSYSKQSDSAWQNISNLFSLYLEGILNSRNRVNIYLVNNQNLERTNVEGSIKSIWIYDKEISENTITQKNIDQKVLEIVYHSFLLLAQELNWDKIKIQNARQKCLDSNMKIDYISKPKSSKDRKHKASIRVRIQNEKAILSVIFYNRTLEVIKEEIIITTFIQYTTVFAFFDNPKWLDHDLFGYSLHNGNLLIRASLSTKGNCIIKNTKHLNDEKSDELEGLMRQLTFREFKSFLDKIQWMNQ